MSDQFDDQLPSHRELGAARLRAQELIHEAKKCAAELGARQLRIHDLEEELAGVRQQLETQKDLVEWMKHALSEQSWHFRATIEALQLQYRHDVKNSKRAQASAAVVLNNADGGNVETTYGHGYAEGQRS